MLALLSRCGSRPERAKASSKREHAAAKSPAALAALAALTVSASSAGGWAGASAARLRRVEISCSGLGVVCMASRAARPRLGQAPTSAKGGIFPSGRARGLQAPFTRADNVAVSTPRQCLSRSPLSKSQFCGRS
eukprot:scaffold37880_cov70-Phaeocystis_antarctica.AAC.6